MLNILSESSSMCCTYVDISKSKVVHFRKRQVERSDYIFKCGNKTLDYISFHKDLGITVSEFLRYDQNAVLLGEAAGRALGSVVANYKSQTFMGYKTYTKSYNSCVCPIMDYSSEIWGYDYFDKTDAAI